MVSPAPQRHAVVIEDDEDIRGLLVVVLEQLDFIVTEAADGSTGVEAVKNTNAELVTLDINPPTSTAWKSAAASGNSPTPTS